MKQKLKRIGYGTLAGLLAMAFTGCSSWGPEWQLKAKSEADHAREAEERRLAAQANSPPMQVHVYPPPQKSFVDHLFEFGLGWLLVDYGLTKGEPIPGIVGRRLMDNSVDQMQGVNSSSTQVYVVPKQETPRKIFAIPGTAAVNGLWLEHNIPGDTDAEKIMAVTIDVNAINMQDERLQLDLYFVDKDKQPLRDIDGSYRTLDGWVTIGGGNFIPKNQNTTQRMNVSMPYSQLDISNPGAYTLGVVAAVTHSKSGKLIAVSDPKMFSYYYLDSSTPYPTVGSSSVGVYQSQKREADTYRKILEKDPPAAGNQFNK